jgi:hypothetical protein
VLIAWLSLHVVLQYLAFLLRVCQIPCSVLGLEAK